MASIMSDIIGYLFVTHFEYAIKFWLHIYLVIESTYLNLYNNVFFYLKRHRNFKIKVNS